MSDLISRRAAIAVANGTDYTGLDVADVTKVTDEVVKGLKQLPSAESEIIRCKDCKYAEPNGKYGCKAYHYKLYEAHEMKPDDFCSRAERKEEE